jgi:hypothetical protein
MFDRHPAFRVSEDPKYHIQVGRADSIWKMHREGIAPSCNGHTRTSRRQHQASETSALSVSAVGVFVPRPREERIKFNLQSSARPAYTYNYSTVQYSVHVYGGSRGT